MIKFSQILKEVKSIWTDEDIKRVTRGVFGFIDPNGKFHAANSEHNKWAEKKEKELGIKYSKWIDNKGNEYNHTSTFELLKRGWIRVTNNSFQVYRLTREEKDIIFMFAKENQFKGIWVEETNDDESNKTILKEDPPEALYEQKLPPSEIFTKDYLKKRVVGKHPKILYHFASQRKAEFNINNKAIKSYMTSGVSLTENPAIAGPGSICFIIDADCVEKLGYTIVPYLYGDTYLREAEWLVTKNPEYMGDHVFSGERISIPSSCWKRITITTDTGDTREFKEYAESKGFEVSFMDWEEEWNQ